MAGASLYIHCPPSRKPLGDKRQSVSFPNLIGDIRVRDHAPADAVAPRAVPSLYGHPNGHVKTGAPVHAASRSRGKLTIGLQTALQNDLMCMLAGEFYLVPLKGAGLRFEAERIGEKTPTADGYRAAFRIVNAAFHDA